MDNTDLKWVIVTALTLPVVIYSYLMLVFSDDIHVYFGVAKIAGYFGSFPANIDAAWESKPVLNRLIFFGLYKIFEPIKDNELLFQIGTKAAVAIVILLACAYMAREVRRKNGNLNTYAVFLIAAVSILTVHIMCIMECEFFAIIGSFLAIGLILSESKYANAFAGIVMVGIFLLKGLTIIMIPMIIIACLLIDRDGTYKKLKYTSVGFVAATGLFLLSCIIWFHNFIPDSLMLFSLAKPANLSIIERSILMLRQTPSILWNIPVLCAGGITTLFLLSDYRRTKDRLRAALLISVWIISLFIAYAQAEFWIYHYTPLILPAVVSIILFLSSHYKSTDYIAVMAIIGLTLAIWFVGTSIFTDTHANQWAGLEKDKLFVQAINIGKEPSVLYLDSGNSPYYVEAPSACRYIAPVIIRRNMGDRDLTNQPAYTQEADCIMSYEGKYIVLDEDWFGLHEPMNSKIANEYRLIYRGYFWNLYQRAVR